jgi:hypothetical protein
MRKLKIEHRRFTAPYWSGWDISGEGTIQLTVEPEKGLQVHPAPVPRGGLTAAEAVEGLRKVVAFGHMADFLGTPAILRKKGGGAFPATTDESAQTAHTSCPLSEMDGTLFPMGSRSEGPPQIKPNPVEVMQGGTAFHDPHRRKRRK